jgi:hypothetical protein
VPFRNAPFAGSKSIVLFTALYSDLLLILTNNVECRQYKNSMRISVKPKTKLGKWSIGLIIIFFLLVAMCLILMALGQGVGDTFFSNLILGIPGFLAGVSVISAFIIGLVSIIKSRERSILVFLAMAIGFYILMVALGEILYSIWPHSPVP